MSSYGLTNMSPPPSPDSFLSYEEDRNLQHYEEGDSCQCCSCKEIGSEKLVIVMVGLPARGKSYVAKKLCRYLNWRQHETRIFNVGEQRRKLVAQPIASLKDNEPHSANFFDPDNEEAGRLREKVAIDTLDTLVDYLLNGGGSIGIFDATNSTVERRKLIVELVERRSQHLKVLFVESACGDKALLESNIQLKLSGPDYKDKDPVLALKDFRKRVEMYEKKYVPIADYEEDNGFSFCKMVDVGRKFISHRIDNAMASTVASYLQHFNLQPRQIWLTRNGECSIDVVGKRGVDPGLSSFGIEYSRALARFIDSQRHSWEELLLHNNSAPPFRTLSSVTRLAETGLWRSNSNRNSRPQRGFHIWTSRMQRSIQTTKFFDRSRYKTKHTRLLDDVGAGVLEEPKYENMHNMKCPRIGREAYLDVINRANAVLLEVERTTDHVLLIAHQHLVATLLAYFQGLEKPQLGVPLGTLYAIEPKPYGVDCKEFVYNAKRDGFDQVQ